MTNINIDYLGLHPDAIPIIAQWHQDEWQHISPNLTTQLRIELYSRYANTPTTPCCLLALNNNIPAGTASLVECDMETHSHLSPWLASVYVHQNYRKQGIATQLISQCLVNARKNDVKTVYLFTPGETQFYLRRGWIFIESTQYQH